MSHRVLIEATSRLHFGLLSFGQSNRRQYGGVGLMVEAPGSVLLAEAAERFSVSGPQAGRLRGVRGALAPIGGTPRTCPRVICDCCDPHRSMSDWGPVRSSACRSPPPCIAWQIGRCRMRPPWQGPWNGACDRVWGRTGFCTAD